MPQHTTDILPKDWIVLVPQNKIDLVPILKACVGDFRHLDVITWLADPKRRNQLEEEASCHVTACGYTEDSTLNAHGLIQLGLLGTELFQFNGAFAPGAVQILDVRTSPHPRTCIDRPKLLDTLATLLLEYDRNCTYEERGKPHLRWNQTQTEFAHLRWILGSFLRLRGKKGFATDPGLKHIHRPTLEHACDTIAQVVKALTPEDYEFICQHELQWVKMLAGSTEYNPLTQTLFSPATFRDDWLADMYDAFKQHGPPSRAYPQQAVFHALAAICLQFALEKGGDRPTVAARLRQRWQRHKADAAKREAARAATAAAGLLRHRQRREADAAKREAEQAARSTA